MEKPENSFESDKCLYNTNHKVTFLVELQVINLQLEWNYIWLRCTFYTFCWFKSITWILRRWSIEFKWANYPISSTYLSLDNVFIFFITHTLGTASEWIFPKFKHVYEPISSRQSPSICLSAWKFVIKLKTPKCLVWAKRFKRLAFLEMLATTTSVHFVLRIMHVLLHW